MHIFLPDGHTTLGAQIFTREGIELSDIAEINLRLIPQEMLRGQFDVYVKVHVDKSSLPRIAPMPQLKEVLHKREEQDSEWGGPAHDDEHSLSDWLTYIDKQLGRAGEAVVTDTAEYRRRLVDIAALALAAMESFDR
jgi:hypothetical protein